MTRPDLSSDQRLEAARTALAGHVADLCARFGGRDGPVGPICPTGAPYLTFVTQGLKPEGEKPADFGPNDLDPLAVVDSWWGHVERYVLAASHSRAVLYWRTRPQLTFVIEGKRRGYYIRSRLVMASQAPPPRRHRSRRKA